MRQVQYVEALTPEEFEAKYNQVCRKISTIGKVVDQFVIGPTKIHIFYEMKDEPVKRERQRRCCECENYVWGRSCPFREGRVNVNDTACEYFNVSPSEVQS